MTIGRRLAGVASALLLLSGAGPAAAQHEGHQMPGQAQAGQALSPEALAACAAAQQQVGAIADHVNARLEAARQTNNPAEMRAVMDDVQAALVEIRSRAALCAGLQDTATARDHGAMGHGPAAGAVPSTAAAAPGDLAEAVDPVCGMKVDPKTAASAAFGGRTYYFCSDADRELFLKQPEKYVEP